MLGHLTDFAQPKRSKIRISLAEGSIIPRIAPWRAQLGWA